MILILKVDEFNAQKMQFAIMTSVCYFTDIFNKQIWKTKHRINISSEMEWGGM